MILSLFLVIFIFSFLLIALGVIFYDRWSGLAIVGFTFLFLLSTIILNGQLEFESGSTVASTYGYGVNGTITSTNQTISYIQTYWKDNTSHWVGLLSSVISAISCFAILINLGIDYRRPHK